jgi:lipopolysaccharide biosynthesis glycosyltransferase
MMKKVAIVIAFNDLEVFNGGSRKGLKEKISYFDQFLILYESLKKNWLEQNFKYQIYVLHSIPFSENKKQILNSLDITVIQVEYSKHKTKIRPLAYTIDLPCDYRLILDVDMLAIKEPKFDFHSDVQAMYGGNKYNKEQWKNICSYVGCKLPSGFVARLTKGTYTQFVFREHYYYNAHRIFFRFFPYFNNGAILVKNELSKQLGETWEKFREKYTEYVKSEFQIDIDFEGQDMMGLAITSVTKNWKPFERGFNFILQDSFELGRKLMRKFSNDAVLVHYINIPQESIFYGLIENAYFEVKKKYYS